MVSQNVFLVTHPLSYNYVKNTTTYIYSTLNNFFYGRTSHLVIERIEDFDYPPNSVVFIIGDPFPSFTKRSDCFYAFINFSLLYNVTGRLFLMPSARKWIQEKHQILVQKANCYDLILDYYPAQTTLMKQDIENGNNNIKVMSFLTNIEPDPTTCPKPLEQCEWDICVIGAVSRRRKKIYDRLCQLGYHLSPYNGDLGTVIANSRLALNVHIYDCDNLELSRILEATKIGRCLVTENCYGLDNLLPRFCYCSDKYSRLVDHIRGLLKDPARMDKIGQDAKDYVNNIYQQQCEQSWRHIFDVLP